MTLLVFGKLLLYFGVLFLIGAGLWYPFKDKGRSIIFFLIGSDMLLIGGSCIALCFRPLGDPSKALLFITGFINLAFLGSLIGVHFSEKKRIREGRPRR
jgi:hypothetical protein